MFKRFLSSVLLPVCASAVLAANRVAFLSHDGSGDFGALIGWTRLQGFPAERVAAWPEGQFKAEGNDLWIDLAQYGLVWLDVNQSVTRESAGPLPDTWLEPKTKAAFLNYVRGGGTLVLSTLAVRYAVDLGLESVPPDDWGQFHGAARVGYQPAGTNELFAGPGPLLTGDGTHLFRWMGYRRAPPAAGRVLARHWQETNFVLVARWDLGAGRVYAVAMLPWLAPDNPQLAGAEQFTRALLAAAKLAPDPARARQAAAELAGAKRARETTGLAELKLSEIAPADSERKIAPAGSFARRTADGFVIGNEFVERRVATAPALHTTAIRNHCSGDTLLVAAAEFRLTLGRERQELNLGPADFRRVGKPKIRKSGNARTVEVTLERSDAPALRVTLRYAVGDAPEIEKSLRLENRGPAEIFLREVWLDTLRFGESVEVVPYTVFAAFARTARGGLWLCQSLPYSVPSSGAAERWIGIAYPPCEPLAPGATYESESAFLTAVRLTGRRCEPSRMTHQISPYGPFQDPRVALDEAEIESCLDFVDRHATQVRQSYVGHFSYHDYGTLGTTDFLPFVKGPGAGWPALKGWLDRSAAYGVRTYLIYPDVGAWLPQPEAERLMTDQVLPYARQLNMNLAVWFSTYTASWYSGAGLKGGQVIASYREPETQQWLVDLLGGMIRKWHLGAIEPDQGNIMIDRGYDQQFGFPGALPLSPHLYREYRAWDRIGNSLRRLKPELQWGIGHFGNHQAPLFAAINTLHCWCEPHDTLREYKSLRDRHPALSSIKAVADGYRREQFWFHRERFVPFRLMEGSVNFQIGTHQATAPEGEPIAQHFRYLLLQNLALHPNSCLYGLDAMTVKGWFGAREQAFARRWFDFQQAHARDLSERPFLPAGEPAYGKVEVYSYGDRGGGWVFLVNPNFVSATARFDIGPETGFRGKVPYAVREISPQERWCLLDVFSNSELARPERGLDRGGDSAERRKRGLRNMAALSRDAATGRAAPGRKPLVATGESVAIAVPGYTVAVLRFAPAPQAWKGLKRVRAGAEFVGDDSPHAAPGEAVEAADFDVSQPTRPGLLAAFSGVAPGTSPRLELTQWRVRAGSAAEPLGAGFADGASVRFAPALEFGEKFSLTDFAGAVLWDLARDPVVERAVCSPASLRQASPGDEAATRAVDFHAATTAGGYWLATECELGQPPADGLIVLQLAAPERAAVKLWINGQPQDCARAHNDWCVLKPTGLVAGRNKLVLWLAEK